jgi:hypothetical protein
MIRRVWNSGDVVDISMPFELRIESFRDNPHRFALLNGPLVLSAAVNPGKPFPAILADETTLLSALKPVTGRPNNFSGPAELFRVAGEQAGHDLVLEPFYKMHGNRHYVVYWDQFTEAQWREREKDYEAEQAKRKALEARTVDHVTPGGEQNERDHHLQGERTNSGDFGDRKYRDASEGGWFSYELKVQPNQTQELRATYWGGDRGRRFDIFIDDRPLASERLGSAEPKFYDKAYPLLGELLKDKEKIVVRFQARTNSWAGGIFDLRVVK